MRFAAPAALFVMAAVWATPVGAQDFSDLHFRLRGATIVAQDYEKTYLGKLASAYDGDSIFNEQGPYGDRYSPKSIWNPDGRFGGEYSLFSPFNPHTRTPPVITRDGKTLGYLTVNESIEGAVSPEELEEIKERF
jgi:hypothetical protein